VKDVETDGNLKEPTEVLGIGLHGLKRSSFYGNNGNIYWNK
jgi:hypothetical protein